MTPDGAKALPCPFCGKPPEITTYGKGAWCADCIDSDGVASIADWNKRTPDPATQRVLEAAKVFLGGIDEEGIYDNDHLKALREAVEALAGIGLNERVPPSFYGQTTPGSNP